MYYINLLITVQVSVLLKNKTSLTFIMLLNIFRLQTSTKQIKEKSKQIFI